MGVSCSSIIPLSPLRFLKCRHAQIEAMHIRIPASMLNATERPRIVLLLDVDAGAVVAAFAVVDGEPTDEKVAVLATLDDEDDSKSKSNPAGAAIENPVENPVNDVLLALNKGLLTVFSHAI